MRPELTQFGMEFLPRTIRPNGRSRPMLAWSWRSRLRALYQYRHGEHNCGVDSFASRQRGARQRGRCFSTLKPEYSV